MRSTFAGPVAQGTVPPVPQSAFAVASHVATLWDSPSGGNQLTDLLLAGTAVRSVVIDASGSLPAVQGPDGVTAVWVDANTGVRFMMLAQPSSAARTATGSTTLTSADSMLSVDASQAPATVTVPDPASVAGKSFVVKKMNTTGYDVTVQPSVGTVDGQPSFILSGPSMPAVTIMSNGTAWVVV